MSDSASRLPACPSLEQLRKQAKERLQQRRQDNPSAILADAQHTLAREYGFESWPALVRHIGELGAIDPRSYPHGLSTTPPFYRIDWNDNSIEPQQPLSDQDWNTIFQVMNELRITGLAANGQMNDKALAGLAELDHVTPLARVSSPDWTRLGRAGRNACSSRISGQFARTLTTKRCQCCRASPGCKS